LFLLYLYNFHIALTLAVPYFIIRYAVIFVSFFAIRLINN